MQAGPWRQPSSTEERLVAELITLMESGQTPWRRPWRREAGPHVNLLSGRPYRGTNPLLLTLGLHLRGSELPYWCGWGEARRLGLAPRRGSRGVMILRPLQRGSGSHPDAAPRASSPPDSQGAADTRAVPEPIPGTNAAPGDDPRSDPAVTPPSASGDGDRGRMLFRAVVVFNASDLVGDGEASRSLVDRINRCRAHTARTRRSDAERLHGAEAILASWPVPLLQGGSIACYRPALDRIELPAADQFESAAARLATWAHEAIHSSGHPRRLNRDLSGCFGSPAYAREELIAELGAVLLGERLEIGSDTTNHAAYLGHWCELLRRDPRVLLQVLGEARRAADLIAPEPGAALDGVMAGITVHA